MTDLLADTLSVVRQVLAEMPEPFRSLTPAVRADNELALDPVIGFSDTAGRVHAVYVQVGDGNVSANALQNHVLTLGGGMRSVMYGGVRHGISYDAPSAGFVRGLRDYLGQHADEFVPTPGPGLGNHPLTPDMVSLAWSALDEHNEACEPDERLRPVLNPEGQTDDGHDVLAFARGDGTLSPVACRTGDGVLDVYDRETGEVRASVANRRSLKPVRGHVLDALREAVPEAAPGMGF